MDERGRVKKLFAFGLGFSAQELASRLTADGWQIAGTARDEANLARAGGQGYEMARFAGEAGNREITRLLQGTTHLIHSISTRAARRSGARALSRSDRDHRHA